MPDPPLPTLKDRRGVSLVELMVAAAIIGSVVVGLIGSLAMIQRGIQTGKNKTLASNLLQEKMQIIKQQSYYRVIPTMTPVFTAAPDLLPYDATYFPPETILEGGVTFTRYTYVQVIKDDSGSLVTLPPTTPDTGMRLITVTVEWVEAGSLRSLAISSVFSNPNSVMTDAIMAGTVTNSVTAAAIQGAVVKVGENNAWRDTTDVNGKYAINMVPGSFNYVASAYGYFSLDQYKSAVSNQTTSLSFALVPMSSGSVTGTAWVNPNVLISQVVASTVQANGMVVQYIELFNPTASAVTVYNGVAPQLKVNYQTASGCANANTCSDAALGIKLQYVNTTIAASSYYLIADTKTFTANGTKVTADAYFDDTANASCSVFGGVAWNAASNPPVKQIMSIGHGGVVWLTDSTGAVLDTFGWSHNGNTPSRCGVNCWNMGATGLADNTQFVRHSSTGAVSQVFGRAYDTDNNSVDFASGTPLGYRPFTASDPSVPVITGRPAVGAIISATDGLSDTATAFSVGNPPVANFALTKIATGTWSVYIASGAYEHLEDNITLTATGSTYNFASSTTLLSAAATSGFITGNVTDIYGSPLVVSVSPGSAGNAVNSTGGTYKLRVSTGYVDVTSNPNNTNSSYISVSSLSVPVALGVVTNGVDFSLSQGGRFSGFVTRDGVNALPGITVAAIDQYGYAHDSQVTDSTGRFTTIDITTGSYTLEPQLDVLETSSPTFYSATVTTGQNVFVGTYTISGALGTISGKVTLSSNTISTGVLIVVTTATLPGATPTPPTLNAAALSASPYYVTSSKEDGTYSIDVRQSTSPTYRVYAFYPSQPSTATVTINPLTITGVSVTAGQSVTGKDFAW